MISKKKIFDIFLSFIVRKYHFNIILPFFYIKKELLSPFYFDIFLSCDSFVHIHLYYSSVHNPIWMSIFFNVTFINIIATAP